jgi:hypothetical protein
MGAVTACKDYYVTTGQGVCTWPTHFNLHIFSSTNIPHTQQQQYTQRSATVPYAADRLLRCSLHLLFICIAHRILAQTSCIQRLSLVVPHPDQKFLYPVVDTASITLQSKHSSSWLCAGRKSTMQQLRTSRALSHTERHCCRCC